MNTGIIRVFLLLCGLESSTLLYSQSQTCPKIQNKRALQLYHSALEKLEYNPKEAYYELKQAIEISPDFIDACFVLADINYQNAINAANNPMEANRQKSYFRSAELYFLKVVDICPSYQEYTACYFLGEYYYHEKNYLKATEFLRLYTDNSGKGYGSPEKAKAMLADAQRFIELMENPVDFNPTPLRGVSTSADEFLPLISPDGELAFYTRRSQKQSRDSYVIRETEEFTFSRLIGQFDSCGCEVFDPGERMPDPFNDGRNQGGVSITIDNRHLYITLCEFTQINNQPYKNCDIYTSDLENGKWTPLKNLGTPVNLNNSWEAQPSVTADDKILYFASSRENGFGGIDIYRAFKDSTGNWSNVQNLGMVINTDGNEKSPFIHSDSQTLYYSSDKLPGMGGYDIFYSKLTDAGWTQPQNIGYPINTEDDDLGFVVSTNGSKAYFSSNTLRNQGGWDIYSFDLYDEARPKKVLLLKGQLTDDQGEALKEARIEMKEMNSGRVTEGLVDKMTGRYAVVVVPGDKEEYLLTVKKKDFAFKSEYLVPEKIEILKPVIVNLEVAPIVVGKSVVINNIYFGFNSDVLNRESKQVLDNFAQFLDENPKIKIRIDGHTDNIDDEEFNMNLSNNRARAVYNYLIGSGIEKERLSYKGFGETHPVATNDTQEGRAKNRRTEFEILEK